MYLFVCVCMYTFMGVHIYLPEKNKTSWSPHHFSHPHIITVCTLHFYFHWHTLVKLIFHILYYYLTIYCRYFPHCCVCSYNCHLDGFAVFHSIPLMCNNMFNHECKVKHACYSVWSGH